MAGIGGSKQCAHADPACAEVARVLRPAGTFNNKLKAEPRPVKLIHCDPYHTLTLADWQALLPAPPPLAPRRETVPIDPYDMRKYAGLIRYAREPIPEGQRHSRLTSFAKWLLKDVGVPSNIAYDLLQQKASVSSGTHPIPERELKEIFKWAQR